MNNQIKIDSVVLRVLSIPLVEPFKVSFGTIDKRDQIILEIRGEGISGWGESANFPYPFYNHETTESALHILKNFAIPIFLKTKPNTPQELWKNLSHIVGNKIAKAGLEMAFWDFHAKRLSQPLYKLLGGKKNEIKVGVSVPIYNEASMLIERVGHFLEKKYNKIKIKIAPGKDIKLVELLFKNFPQIPLMVDANSAYTLDDINLFKELDQYKLMMIEQPLRETDIFEHAKLQKLIKNPICLDESIEDVHDATAAIEIGSCKIINIKTSRVGGLTESLLINEIAEKNVVGVWCGGMLETGIGRAHNMALATLDNFIYPGDISESKRYYYEDIVTPEIVLSDRGTLQLIDKPGIGFEVNMQALKRYLVKEEVFDSRDF